MSELQLRERIIELSDASEWSFARREWELESIYFADDPETCLCGHYPIIELCNLRNTTNGNAATVGNCCVKRFLNLPSDGVFQGVRKIKVDRSKSMNEAAVHFAFGRGWITAWERDFYLDIWRKRVLSEKQANIKHRINEKVLARLADAAKRGGTRS